jgi:hypothetical protein
MPRFARLEAPGAVHHLVSRFVNEEYRLEVPGARREYLRRVPGALQRSDSRPLSYCLMSNHTHWGTHLGADPSANFVKPLHVGIAGWLNRVEDRLGPVFADRHRSIVCDPTHAALLIAYIHNNPVRAGVVRDPADSDWSSHRAYLGLAEAPPWLDVQAGLAICGFDTTPKGRLGFHEFVVSHSRDPRSDQFSASGVVRQRALIREVLGSSIECSWPTLEHPSRLASTLFAPRHRLPVWPGDAEEVIALVAGVYGLDVSKVGSRVKDRAVVRLRRVLLHLWTCHMGRSQGEMGPLLGLSSSASSQLLRTGRADWKSIDEECAVLADLLRRGKCVECEIRPLR